MPNKSAMKGTGLLVPLTFLRGIPGGFSARQSPPAPPPQATQAKPAAGQRQQPRGRSITLGDVSGLEFKDNVFTIAAGFIVKVGL